MADYVSSAHVQKNRLTRAIALAIAVAVIGLGVACGGGSRGTGIYGVDGLQPGKLVDENQRVPLYVPPETSVTPTPKP